MTWAVVVRQGQHLNATLASICFDQWGTKTYQPIILCDDWLQGQQLALDRQHTQALFVDSGTVFTDWWNWHDLLQAYPHRGLIGHIIWHPGGQPYLHEQCWFMDLTKLRLGIAPTTPCPIPVRSDRDLHDGYTPMWIRPGIDMANPKCNSFGQDLICQQLGQLEPVMNWNLKARSMKHFLYGDSKVVKDLFADYLAVAEQQFWVLNNEPIKLLHAPKLVMPGSGLYWILNLLQSVVESIAIVDISRTQIQFCAHTWQYWNGHDWGSWTWQFIKDNAVKHFQLDQANFSALEMLRFKNPKNFIRYVNDRVDQLLLQHGYSTQSFEKEWNQARNKKIVFANQNIVQWSLKNQSKLLDYKIWTSNVLDYKWTLLNTPYSEMEKFMDLVDEISDQ